MEDTPFPKYSSDSFISIKSEETGDEGNHETLNEQKQIVSASKSHCVPWKQGNTYSYGVIGLHEEINDFYKSMCPTEQEKEIRLRVVEHITKTVHSMWPHAQVEVFGSFRTGLYLPSSDIDMVIFGEWRGLPLQTLSKALQQNGISESDITVIERATVPIVRLKHTPSNVKVDISFNMENGVQGALYIKELIKVYPPLPKLVLVLKQFLVQRGLNEVYNGGMSSYCLTLLIVSLLQGSHKPASLPSKNLGTLLLEFFEHYGINFNFSQVSIHFAKAAFYQRKYRCDNHLSVEDPLVKGNDVAKGTYLMTALKNAFENAFLLLHTAVMDSAAEKKPLNSYLSLIVNVEEKLLDERRWLLQNYSQVLKKLTELAGVQVKREEPYGEKQEYNSESQRHFDKKNLKKKRYRYRNNQGK